MTVARDSSARRSRGAARLTGLVAAVALATMTGVTGCSSSSSGAGSTGKGSPADGKTVTVSYPLIAPVRLPDVSVLGSGGGVLSAELTSLGKAEDTGFDVVSPTCDAQGSPVAAAPDVFKLTEVQTYLNTDGNANVKLTTDRDGTKHYLDLGGDKNLTMVVRRNGSGEIKDLGGDRNLSVTANKDGSGQLTDLGRDATLKIVVNADGSGHLVDLGASKHLSIDVAADGTGRLVDLGDDANLTIVIAPIGAAELRDLGGDNNLQVTVATDGSGHYKNRGGDRNLTFDREPDGAVHLVDLGGSAHLELIVASDGSGSYRNMADDVSFDFGANGRATDGSGYRIQLPQAPVFSAPDRFPPLGKLGRLRAPCATVLRFAADALFDFDKATLKPQALAMITRAATVLAKADKPIQVEGHTDAKGSDAYNDDLSLRRAQAFAAALKEHGVNVTITTKGWGEKRPVAPNTTADGKDNPSGRAQNRRVEVVLKN